MSAQPKSRFVQLFSFNRIVAFSRMATREVAPLPMRTAAPSLKLPILPPFDTPESIVLALSSRELPILTAGKLRRTQLA